MNLAQPPQQFVFDTRDEFRSEFFGASSPAQGDTPFGPAEVIALLSAGNTSMEIDLKKGSLCKLEAETLRYGRCATLVCLLAPRHLVLMTGKSPAK